MAGVKRFTAEVRRRFLEHLRATANVAESARLVGISRSRMYDLRAKDPLLAREWDEAVASTTDRLESEAIRRAVEGVKKPYYYQGKECGEVVEYSDPLLKFLLQKRLPERYGDEAVGDRDQAGSTPGPVVFEMHLGGTGETDRAESGRDPDQCRSDQIEPKYEANNESEDDPDYDPEYGLKRSDAGRDEENGGADHAW